MESLVNALLSNALVATGLALAPLVLSRFGRSPALVHSLWLVVLLKLVTPPLVQVPLVMSSTAPQVRPSRDRARFFQAHPGAADGSARTAREPACKTDSEPTERDGVAQSIEPAIPAGDAELGETERWVALRCRCSTRQRGLMSRTRMPRAIFH